MIIRNRDFSKSNKTLSDITKEQRNVRSMSGNFLMDQGKLTAGVATVVSGLIVGYIGVIELRAAISRPRNRRR